MLRRNHGQLNRHLLMAEEGPDPPFSATSGRNRRGACDIRIRPHWVSHKGYTKKRQRLRRNTSKWIMMFWYLSVTRRSDGKVSQSDSHKEKIKIQRLRRSPEKKLKTEKHVKIHHGWSQCRQFLCHALKNPNSVAIVSRVCLTVKSHQEVGDDSFSCDDVIQRWVSHVLLSQKGRPMCCYHTQHKVQKKTKRSKPF